MEDEIGKRFKRSQPLRNDIIQKWDDKTRLNITSSHRKSHDGPQATLTQIDQVRLLHHVPTGSPADARVILVFTTRFYWTGTGLLSVPGSGATLSAS